jgi:predicted transcriptional regulator
LSFQDSYNKLLSEKEGLVQIEQAKTHLLDKLDKLYDGLWDSIKNKKDEAVQKRRLFMNSSWLVDHSQ